MCPVTKAIHELAGRVRTAETESIPVADVAGRVLGADLQADRDSPASDVSAMDGFAIRYIDYQHDSRFEVIGESVAGRPVDITLSKGQAMKIFTGASVPQGADTVIERELASEDSGVVRLNVELSDLRCGRNLRKQGENTSAGAVVLRQGTIMGPSQVAALVSFASSMVCVRKKVRVSIINTGSELVSPGESVMPWQIRDSNGPFLSALLNRMPYVETVRRLSVVDDEASTSAAIESALQDSDVLLLTGGVSAGDYDFVPQVLKMNGVETVFHRLPQKPGKPILGGVGPCGQLVCGLPGNPVSVAVTARRIALPLMQIVAGCDQSYLNGSPIQVICDVAESGSLVLYRLARREADNFMRMDNNKGSGDLVSLGQSDGFIELNPFCASKKVTRNFYPWAV